MLFNSLPFALFFAVVLAGCHLLRHHRAQNLWLLAASYFFYGYWNWKLLGLLLFSTFLGYFGGRIIAGSRSPRVRRSALAACLAGNLLLLFFFKYYNFFAGALEDVLCRLGLVVFPGILTLVLPVGISFYTFQSISYTVDVYRGTVPPVVNVLDFALYKAFFPQLVAGPIERAAHMMPQIQNPRPFDFGRFSEGFHWICWGLFQKVFVADNLARLADRAFSGSGADGWEVLCGLYAFAFQIYGDFAGYSNIARGTAMMLGFDLVVNFDLPYFSASPREFWQRWHISLSTWLRDYVYIPLGGNRRGLLRGLANVLVTLLLGGLWHGAAWTYVIWGLYHGVWLALHRLWLRLRPASWVPPPVLRGTWSLACGVVTFHLVCLGWLIFRAESLTHLWRLLSALGTRMPWAEAARMLPWGRDFLFYTALLIGVEIFQRRRGRVDALLRGPVALRALVYVAGFYLMVFSGAPHAKEFIYFQF